MFEIEKSHSTINFNPENLDANFVDDYSFWRGLVNEINDGLFTYDEFCTAFKDEILKNDVLVDLSIINRSVKNIIFKKISKR